MNATDSQSRVDRLAAVLGPMAVLLCLVWMAGWTGRDAATGSVNSSAAIDGLAVLVSSAPWAIAWLAASVGAGWPLQRWIAPNAKEPFALQLALGVASMLFLDHALGAAGWLQAADGLMAWAMLLAGIIALMAQLAIWIRERRQFAAPHWMFWAASPAIAVLLLAASSAPGWLWATEFGGYDALSYHLQLPREWLARGAIQPLHHNVYSYLPGYVEAAYYHLAVLQRDGVSSAYSCQFLHAALALATAYVVARAGYRIGGRLAGALAAAIFLGTPWIIVVGSLAYNEMPVILMLAGGWLAVEERDVSVWRRGAIVGALAGAACGAKLTAVGFVAAPLAALLVISVERRATVKTVAIAVTIFMLTLSPYLVRNLIHAGNPVFPFATELLGLGHWSAEQAQIWRRGHISDATAPARLTEFWNQFLRFGIGPNPAADEPWKPQWSILPCLALAAIGMGLWLRESRRIAIRLALVLLIQIVFWILFTHLKSRFMLPAAAPLAVAVALLTPWLRSRTGFALQAPLALALVFWCLVAAWIYRNEAGGAPALGIGRIGALTGGHLSPQARQELGASTFPAVAVNYLLAPDARVLLIGQAAPFYFDVDKVMYQTTWDRGLLSRLMREFPEDPALWAAGLRASGFTHVVIDETMLTIWQNKSWNDPLLTSERVRAFAERFAQQVYAFPNGVSLHRLDQITEKTPSGADHPGPSATAE